MHVQYRILIQHEIPLFRFHETSSSDDGYWFGVLCNQFGLLLVFHTFNKKTSVDGYFSYL